MPSFEKETNVFILVYTWIMISKSECDIFWVNQPPNIFAYQKLHGGKMVWMKIHIYQNSYLNAHLNILITNLIFKWIFWITRPKPPYGRQGLAGYWGKGNILIWQTNQYFVGRLWPSWSKNVTWPTRGPNRPPGHSLRKWSFFVTHTFCYWRGDPTDLLDV